MVILLAKLCGADKPTEIADWGEKSSRGNNAAVKLEVE